MGTVKAYRKTHWVVALDADLASIPNPQLADTAMTEDKQKLYYWQGGAWKTGLGYESVPEPKGSIDWTGTDFTLDGAVHENGLSLTGKVPVGTKIVGFSYEIMNPVADKKFVLMGNQTTKAMNRIGAYSQVANVYNGYHYGRLCIDDDRLVDYQVEAGMIIALTVVDWDI